MTKNSKTVYLALLAAVVVLAAGYFLWDRLHSGGDLDCGDGPRKTIDTRDFQTRYWAYSVELEASLADQAKVAAKLTPQQMQQLSEAMQSGAEFRKYVVAGYNACAISKQQYQQWGPQFQALDSLARQINSLLAAASLSPAEHARLAQLIGEYGDLLRKLGQK